MTIIFKKSFLRSKEVREFVRKSRLDEFKRRILEHLSKLEAKEKKKDESVQKALAGQEALRKAGYPVGTVREWKGKKYVKTAPGKWRPKYDSDSSRGAKQSIAAIKKKVSACATAEELLQVVKENKHRFTDENGQYLPFVKELFDYVGKKHKEIKGAKNAGQPAGSKAKAGGGSDDFGHKKSEETAKPNLYDLSREQHAAYNKMMAKFKEADEALHRANVRTEERVRAFLKENKAIRGNQRVDRAHLGKVEARLSPEKREELHALYSRAEKEERAKEADRLFEEHERLEAEYEAIKEKADKARKEYYQREKEKTKNKRSKGEKKPSRSLHQAGTTDYDEEELVDVPF